ncbi:EAL domain-containing protein [Wenzhouxiangella sp. XN79A]|uniref:bifunctional diguanylate cyclase/phosphodiesterase n=1 Tax=Wenzhouxiangella sp. XN79A TaxID=2724193 RepID=UPI00144AF4A2|nr:EAL domain-containing protein [Wenzhouxiangella sp. XN79A]NKI36608.1 EAL domain-containing protein [Wenzhouxiangella sp. XN79A]
MAERDASETGMLLDGNDLPEGMARVVSATTLIGELEKRCKQARAAGGSLVPVAVAWIQLDEMQAHRNQVGFTGLERLMRAIHDRIRTQLDPPDVTARFGLNSIGVLLDPEDGERDYADLGTGLLRTISGSLFEFGEQALAATISIAIRPANEQLRVPEANLVGVARMAERLSAAGGNRTEVAAAEANDSGNASSSLLAQLTKALRDNSLRVVFQPLLATTGPEADRFQVLPRLIGSDGSLIPAARFIPVAAARGVLPALDQWMIAHVLGLIRDRIARGDEPAWYFINQSSALVDDPKFLAWFEAELTRLPAEQRTLVVEFNILELKARLREAREALAKLRDLGIGVSLTGIDEKVPEAVMLKHIPCDYLRMKADFARRVLAEKDLAERFQKFAHSAHHAERKLVVPMLEDAEAVSRIWQMDVDLIQGNFIQQPSEQPGI